MSLEQFRKKLNEYTKEQAGKSIEALADAMGISLFTLSHKIHGSHSYKKGPSIIDVKDIAKILTQWEVLGSQAQVLELYTLLDYRNIDFSQGEWVVPPLNRLKKLSSELPVWRQSNGYNLPSSPDAFVGRKAELEELSTLIQNPVTRLIVITGTGGVGKTRLSVQLAFDLLPVFEDDAFFVDLVTCNNRQEVIIEIAKALGIQKTGNTPLIKLILNYLQCRKTLLVLDNFEHLLDASPVINELLAGTALLKIIVTSRSILSIEGEYEFKLEPLPLPDPQKLPALATLTKIDSIALFIQQARAAKNRHQFDLNGSNVRVIAKICVKLEGIPLAIQLAAGKVRKWSLEEILSQLSNRLEFLINGPRNWHYRQQTMEATIKWSYDLLSVEEQELFRRLAVFRGSFAARAAKYICYPTDATALANGSFERLHNITEQKILMRISENTNFADSRFQMLQTIREFALKEINKTLVDIPVKTSITESEQVIKMSEMFYTQSWHLTYYMNLVFEQLIERPESVELSTALETLDVEYPNIVDALEWSLAPQLITAENTEQSLVLASICERYWKIRGFINEGLYYLESLLKVIDSIPYPPSNGRGLALLGAASFTQQIGEYEKSLGYLNKAEALWSKMGNAAYIWQVRNTQALALINLGKYQQAEILLEKCRGYYIETKNNKALSSILQNKSILARRTGQLDKSYDLAQQSLSLLDEQSDRDEQRAEALHTIGNAALESGQFEKALGFLNESLELKKALGYAPGIADTLFSLAQVYFWMIPPDHNKAWSLFEMCLEQMRGQDNKLKLAETLYEVGFLSEKDNEVHPHKNSAQSYYQESLGLFRELRNKAGMIKAGRQIQKLYL